MARKTWKWEAPYAVGDGPQIFLTEQESNVLECLCRGMDTERMTQELHISVNTLKTHEKAIKQKFGVRSRHGILAVVLMNRLSLVVQTPVGAM